MLLPVLITWYTVQINNFLYAVNRQMSTGMNGNRVQLVGMRGKELARMEPDHAIWAWHLRHFLLPGDLTLQVTQLVLRRGYRRPAHSLCESSPQQLKHLSQLLHLWRFCSRILQDRHYPDAAVEVLFNEDADCA